MLTFQQAIDEAQQYNTIKDMHCLGTDLASHVDQIFSSMGSYLSELILVIYHHQRNLPWRRWTRKILKKYLKFYEMQVQY